MTDVMERPQTDCSGNGGYIPPLVPVSAGGDDPDRRGYFIVVFTDGSTII